MLKKNYLSIGLLSLSILSTELFWTKIFSAEYYYTFAFLILSLAILGLGLGALFIKLFSGLNKPHLLPVWLSVTGLMILVSVPLVFLLNLNFVKLISEPSNLLILVSVVLLLGSAFFFGGMAIAQIFKVNFSEIPKLYMSDLVGAASGVILFLIVMNTFGADITLLFCAFPVLLASFILANKWMKIIPLAVFLCAVFYYSFSGGLPEQKREERAKVIYKHWDAMAKLKVYEYDSLSRGINIDNVANTPVIKFDGNWNKPDSEKIEFDINVGYLIKKFKNCSFLSLGSGGGGDVLQALGYNAAEVHAVEVIPHINYLLKDGFLKEYSGDIYNNPRVNVVTEDARTYIRKFENKFDIIYSWSSNTWAALASGSFALAENYIFTTEAFIDYWKALSSNGYLVIEHQFYMPRLVAELTDAFQQLKISEPNSHFAVYNLPSMRRKVLLVSKLPLDFSIINNALGKITPENSKNLSLLYPLMEKDKSNVYNDIVQSGWKKVSDTVKVDISPCTDDKPFIAQTGLMKNLELSKLDKIPNYEFTGFPLSTLTLYIILLVCLIIILPVNLLPFLKNGKKLGIVPWSYFFFIGIGFMMIEVILIQKYTLFIGSSVYSIALILTSLLLCSGIGSKFSEKFSHKIVFPAIMLWLLFDVFIFKHLFYLFDSWDIVPRMILNGLLIAPLGFFLGMPFPKLASKFQSQVDWAFAVNGSASVIGSVVIILIASSYGYSIALLSGLLMYLIAFGLYSISLNKFNGVQNEN